MTDKQLNAYSIIWTCPKCANINQRFLSVHEGICLCEFCHSYSSVEEVRRNTYALVKINDMGNTHEKTMDHNIERKNNNG